MADLIEYKREHGSGRPAPEPASAESDDDMTDLLTALRRSVEAAGGTTDAPVEQESAKTSTDEPETSAPKKSTSPKKRTSSKGKKAAGEDTPDEEPAPRKKTKTA